MKITTFAGRAATVTTTGLVLVLLSHTPLPAEELTPGDLKGTVTMELIGQAQVLSPLSAIQYGYLSRIAGLDTIFSGTPQNESTAIFTFYNDTATTRVINNGPLRIVNRGGDSDVLSQPERRRRLHEP